MKENPDNKNKVLNTHRKKRISISKFDFNMFYFNHSFSCVLIHMPLLVHIVLSETLLLALHNFDWYTCPHKHPGKM